MRRINKKRGGNTGEESGKTGENLKINVETKRRTKHEINLNLLYKQNLIKIHFI